MSRKRRVDAPYEPELPITPMLDMSFQILFYFVMIYHPSALEVQLDLNLPALGQAKAKRAEDVDPKAQSDTNIEVPADVTVLVTTFKREQQGQGGIDTITVQSPSGGEKVVTLTELGPELKALHAKVGDAKDIKIQADSKLKWAFVVKVMDVCHASGFEGISFGSPPDEGR